MSLSKVYKKNKGIKEETIRPFDLNRSGNLGGETVITAQNVAEPSSDAITTSSSSFSRPKVAGLEEVEMQFNETAKALAAAIEEISRVRRSVLTNSSQDMLRLVMAICRHVIQHEISSKEDIILTTITQALNAAIKSDAFHIKVNPDDFAFVNEKKPLFLASISGLNNISFEADPNISRGGCLVESDVGQVDATIEAKLEEMHQQLMHSMANNSGTSD